MEQLELFTKALRIENPWVIERIEFRLSLEIEELHIYLSHERGVRFDYEGESCPVYDHQYRTWRHLGFFQYKCYVHAEVPRVMNKENKVRLVKVPWAQRGSGFTMLFERRVMSLVKSGLSVKAASEQMDISDKRAFRIIDRYVSNALATQDLEQVESLSIDETSRKKGHKYFTILTDRVAKKVVGISLGKGKESVDKALIDMEVRGSVRERVRDITMDMSKSYISAAINYMPQAQIIFDRFHLRKSLNEAVDKVRRDEQREYAGLKKSRYIWLKNESKLSEKQRDTLHTLAEAYPTIGRAHRLKELFREVMNHAYQSHYLQPLNQWMKMAWESEIAHIKDFVNLLHRHWYGVKAYVKTLATNAYAESMNLKIQQIKRIAKGYRNHNNFIKMIYFHIGKLELSLTHFK